MNLFNNPDFVASFSSRGPVSPFYIKPDIVAPGAYINTTQMEDIILRVEQVMQHHMFLEQQHYYFKKTQNFIIMK